jgi:hypothetical protein
LLTASPRLLFLQALAARGAAAALALPPGAIDAAADAAAVTDAATCALAATLGGGAGAVAGAGGAAALAASLAPPAGPWAPVAGRALTALMTQASDGVCCLESEAGAAAAAAALPTLAALADVDPTAASAAATAAGKRAKGAPPAADALTAQVDAVAALALLLSPPPAAPRLAAAVAAAASADPGGWPIVARTGLESLLRARAGAGVRHAALRAGAALADAAGGAAWLTRPGPASAGGRGAPAAFLAVLAEVARVEAALLFRDAAAEPESAPAVDPAPTPAPHPSGVPPSSQEAVDAAAARWAARSTPDDRGSAASRAERTLPAVLVLTEAALGALAADAEAGQDAADEAEAQGGVAAADAGGLVFPDAVAVRAYASLQDAVEQGLDYLELLAETPTAPTDRDPLAAPLATAAARVLARLLLDCPTAFGSRPRTLLPRLLSAGGGAAAHFFVPVLAAAAATALDADDVSLDDGDADAWLAAGREAGSLAGLGAAAAAAAAAATRSGAGDAAVAALASVLADLLEPTRAGTIRLAAPPGLAPALAAWAAARVESGARAAARAEPPSLDATLAVAHVLCLSLAATPDAGLPAEDAALIAASTLACLQRGWAAAILHAQRASAAAKAVDAGQGASAAHLAAAGLPAPPPPSADPADAPPLSPEEAAASLIAWSRALAAAAVALETSPTALSAAKAAPWVAELAAAPASALPPGAMSDGAGAAAALRLFVGTVRRLSEEP